MTAPLFFHPMEGIVKRILTASAVIAALATVLPALGPARAAETSDRFTEKGLITVCADPYIYPASAQGYPPGYDVDIIRKIAEDGGYRVEHVWVDTGTRGGLGKAIRNSIAKGLCDVFLGIGVNDMNIDELAEKDLVFTDPYLGLAFILVVQGQAANASTLDDLKDIKIGVPMSTPVDGYLFDNGYKREIYLGNRRVMRGMVQGEVDAALIWSPSLAKAKKEFPDNEFLVAAGWKPHPDLRWNVAMVVPAAQTELMQYLNDSICSLTESGDMQRMVERYGAHYFSPFE